MFLISYLHQTTTGYTCKDITCGCFLSRIYIKPQQLIQRDGNYLVVSYLVSTSNHNGSPNTTKDYVLFLISYLHQTTTRSFMILARCCCFLSRIYIKPQLGSRSIACISVVSYLVSTSNHNDLGEIVLRLRVVSYLVSTSNHNLITTMIKEDPVVSYLVSTSNHNHQRLRENLKAVVSYLVSTSNHNQRPESY